MLVYLQAIGSGPEKSKFERIFALYQGRMYHTAYQILRSRQDAEDAAHQALLAIAKNISRISAPECTKTLSYIVTITENKAIDMYRSRRRRSALPLDETMGISCPMPDGAVARAIVGLPARYHQLRTCIHNRGMPDGRGFFSSDKEIFRSHTDVWQGKATPYGGKKAPQAAFNGYEYRFCSNTPKGTPMTSWRPCWASATPACAAWTSGPSRNCGSF